VSAAAQRLAARAGIGTRAADAIVAALTRPRGLLVFSGPTGQGKTTLALLAMRAVEATTPFFGDLRDLGAAQTAVREAAKRSVVAAVRCDGAVRRLEEMGVTPSELEAARVVVVRQRLVRSLCVVEVAALDGALLTESLAVQARDLVAQSRLSADAAREYIPGYED
jgi:type II secretory ATPase GspE/PulE/Tfp pilus assembly ATPase PilB-like protein